MPEKEPNKVNLMSALALAAFLPLVALSSCSKRPETMPLVGVSVDYSDESNWMILPKSIDYAVDVIYFNTTVYSDPDGDLVGGITSEAARAAARAAFLTTGSAFETVGNIFVPFYRQVNGAFFSTMTEDEIRDTSFGESRTDLFGEKSFHNYDYAFYFVNIRENAALRAERFIEKSE